MRVLLLSRMGVLVLAVIGPVRSSQASDMTAFGLIKEGDKYVGVQAKDKVVQVVKDALHPNSVD